jgi:phosphoglycerate dehydrogenase-like enzyme
MAEATIMMVLSCLYDFNASQRRLRDGVPNPPALTARMLKGKTLGFIGYGGIAKAMTARLTGWGVRLQAHTPRPPAGVTAVTFVGLDELLATSDITCVLAPLNDAARNLLNARRLASTRAGSILVVTSRGGIVDEAALYDLASRGHFSAVALDVFATEPLPADSPLRRLENAVLTPHCVGLTQDSRAIMVEVGVINVLNVLEGKAPLYVRNPQILEAWRARWG